MKAIEVLIYWANKIWPWIVVPTLIFGAIVVGVLWGEAKKAVRS
jgi:ABC-type uncharacterized transport system permease subunit